MRRWFKAVELLGRRFLFWLSGLLFGVSARPLPSAFGNTQNPLRILVVRLDERLGNVILLTPTLASLKAMYPNATIDVVVAQRAVPILRGHSAVRQIWPFSKKALWRGHGIVGTCFKLRRQHYHLAIDGANPTCPSLTHALMVRFCGAAHTLGHGIGGMGRLYSQRVPPMADEAGLHEIDLRLRLLQPLPPPARCRTMQVSQRMALPEGSTVPAFVRSLDGALFALINVGARTTPKQLRAADYAVVANAVTVAGMLPVLSFGPQELALAQEVANFSASTILAPPTGVSELAYLMQRALCVISCDTGPMHLAVALGRPTCGLFVSTDPRRYGHKGGRHGVIDARGREHGQWLGELRAFINRQRLCEVNERRPPELLPEEMTPILVEGSLDRPAGASR
jgi:ADP-heptose:LPS heptosyltransferase